VQLCLMLDDDADLMAVFQDNPVNRHRNVSVLDSIGAKDEGDVVDNWSCKTCKAPIKSSPINVPKPLGV